MSHKDPPTHNQERLLAAAQVLDPSRVLLGSLAVFFVGLTVVPLTPAYELNAAGILYWFVSALLAAIGFRLGSTGTLRRRATAQPPLQLITAARRTVLIGAVGVALLIFERYAVREVPVGYDFSAVREALERRSPGVMGLLAAWLSAFAPFGLIMLWLVQAQGVRAGAGWRLLATLGVAIYILLPLTGGSRSGLLMTLLIHVGAVWYLRRLRGSSTRVGIILVALGIFTAVGVASALIMQERMDLMGLDPMLSIEISAYAEAVQPSAAAISWLNSWTESAAFAASAFGLCQYVYHGFFEFNLLYSAFAGDHTLGGMTLWLPAKVVSIFTGLDLSVDLENLPGWREGIFTTFMGPLYLDFGVLAPLVLLLGAWVLGWPAGRLRQGNLLWQPAACVAAAIALLFPVVNILDSASGSYLLTAAVTIPFLSGRPRRAKQWQLRPETERR